MNRRFVAGAAVGVAAQLSAVGLLLASAWLIARAAEQPPVLYLMVAIVSVRFFGIARALLRYLERLLTHDAAFAMVTQARTRLYGTLERLTPQVFAGRRRGDVVSRVVADIDSLQDRWLRIRLPWVTAIVSAVVVVALVAWIAVDAAVVLAGGVALTALTLRVVGPRAARHRGAGLAPLRGQLAAEVSHLSLAAVELVAHGATAGPRAEVDRLDRALAAAQRRSAWAGGFSSAFVLLMTGLTAAAIALVTDLGAVPGVMVAVAVLAPIALVEPLEALGEAERLRPEVDGARDRLAALERTPAPVVPVADPVAPPEAFDLQVRDLAVGWDEPVAAHISFDLPAGEAIAVTGPSGSGKSTLALTLLGLLPPRAGDLRLGGVDVAHLDGDALRERVGMLGQDAHVFDSDLRQNLRIADPAADDEQLLAALARAGLGAFVAGLPDGLDTLVGEHGSRLSGGERQRLGLARLLLGGHRVLVLDEPTEHLDEDAAAALLDDVLALAPRCSVVVVTHAAWVRDRVGRSVALTPAAGAPLVAAR
jgi:ATP-binding cassette subfamily C protein CydC